MRVARRRARNRARRNRGAGQAHVFGHRRAGIVGVAALQLEDDLVGTRLQGVVLVVLPGLGHRDRTGLRPVGVRHGRRTATGRNGAVAVGRRRRDVGDGVVAAGVARERHVRRTVCGLGLVRHYGAGIRFLHLVMVGVAVGGHIGQVCPFDRLFVARSVPGKGHLVGVGVLPVARARLRESRLARAGDLRSARVGQVAHKGERARGPQIIGDLAREQTEIPGLLEADREVLIAVEGVDRLQAVGRIGRELEGEPACGRQLFDVVLVRFAVFIVGIHLFAELEGARLGIDCRRHARRIARVVLFGGRIHDVRVFGQLGGIVLVGFIIVVGHARETEGHVDQVVGLVEFRGDVVPGLLARNGAHALHAVHDRAGPGVGARSGIGVVVFRHGNRLPAVGDRRGRAVFGEGGVARIAVFHRARLLVVGARLHIGAVVCRHPVFGDVVGVLVAVRRVAVDVYEGALPPVHGDLLGVPVVLGEVHLVHVGVGGRAVDRGLHGRVVRVVRGRLVIGPAAVERGLDVGTRGHHAAVLVAQVLPILVGVGLHRVVEGVGIHVGVHVARMGRAYRIIGMHHRMLGVGLGLSGVVAVIVGYVGHRVRDDSAAAVVLFQGFGAQMPFGRARVGAVGLRELVGLAGKGRIGVGRGHRDLHLGRTRAVGVLAIVPVHQKVDVFHAHARVHDAQIVRSAVALRRRLIGDVVVLLARCDEIARHVLGIRGRIDRIAAHYRVTAHGGFHHFEGGVIGGGSAGPAGAAPVVHQIVGVDLARFAVAGGGRAIGVGARRRVQVVGFNAGVDELLVGRDGPVVGKLHPLRRIAVGGQLGRVVHSEVHGIAVEAFLSVVPLFVDGDRRIARLPGVGFSIGDHKGLFGFIRARSGRSGFVFLRRFARGCLMGVAVAARVGFRKVVNVFGPVFVVARQAAGGVAMVVELVIGVDVEVDGMRFGAHDRAVLQVVRIDRNRARADLLAVARQGEAEGGAVLPVFEPLRHVLVQMDGRRAHERVGERGVPVAFGHVLLVEVAAAREEVGLPVALVGHGVFVGAVVVVVGLHRAFLQLVADGLAGAVVFGQHGAGRCVGVAAMLHHVVGRRHGGGFGAEPAHGHAAVIDFFAVAVEVEIDRGLHVLARGRLPGLGHAEVGGAGKAVFHDAAVGDVVVGHAARRPVVFGGDFGAVAGDAHGHVGILAQHACGNAAARERFLGEVDVAVAALVEVG